MRQGRFRTELSSCDDIICGKDKKNKENRSKDKNHAEL